MAKQEDTNTVGKQDHAEQFFNDDWINIEYFSYNGKVLDDIRNENEE